jgi:hypothetical protein
VSPQFDECSKAQLARLQLQLLETATLRLREVEVLKIAVRLSAHEREGLLDLRKSVACFQAARFRDEPREALCVDGILSDRQPVAKSVSGNDGS